jgi:diguanylate cyclase (GGDEF)-like protein
MSLLYPSDPTEPGDAAAVRQALDRARRGYYENPSGALVEAIRCHEFGRALDQPGLCARARALQGAISLHRGDLSGALAVAVEAERHAERSQDATAQTEVAALKAQLSFFTGAYAPAVSHAERALQLADDTGDDDLRIYVRRATCLVFGNVGVRDWRHRLDELLELTIACGDLWEEAISRNDIACWLQEEGNVQEAEQEIDRAVEVAERVPGANSFALAVVHSTRADIRLLGGRPCDALEDARRSIELLTAGGEPNPYVLGATVRAEVQARMALGQFEDARESGEDALALLGESVPRTRSLILNTLAAALREAGRIEEAYDALARAAELERQAFRELSDLHLSLERANLEATAARRETDALAAKNRQLEEAHAELERRASQLEGLQEQLREQAERDPLTGVHNRRFLSRALDRLATERIPGPLSLAVLDLDHFKQINDQFGHATGDQVLVLAAGLLCDALRASDIVVRSGGEEFLVLMPSTDAHAATVCCQRIREALHDEDWERISPGLFVTTSVGVATAEDPSNLDALISLADQRLYQAKREGRDRVVGEDRGVRAA